MNNPFHALFKQGRLDREIASNIVQHLLEQDGKDRDLQREFARYRIERDKKENFYKKALSLILLFSGLGGLFAIYYTRGTDLHPDTVYLWMVLSIGLAAIGLLFGIIVECLKNGSNRQWILPDSFPDNKNLESRWENFFKLINEAGQKSIQPPVTDENKKPPPSLRFMLDLYGLRNKNTGQLKGGLDVGFERKK